MVQKAIVKPASAPKDTTISGVATSSAVTLVSTDSFGNASNGWTSNPAFSPDGTKVLFTSSATNLVLDDTNGIADLFIKDLTTGLTTKISGIDGALSGWGSYSQVFSPDGTKVVYLNASGEVYINNLTTGIATLVSTSATGEAAIGFCTDAIFSPDGNKIAFYSNASNLVANDTNGINDVFVKDLSTGVVTRIEMPGQIAGVISPLSFSPDGTKLAFSTDASGLVAGDTNGASDIFIKDLVTGTISLVSTDSSGIQGNDGSSQPVFSPDGKNIAYFSFSDNLVANDTNYAPEIFIKNLETGVTTRVSTDANGQQITGYTSNFSFAPDGKSCVFFSGGAYTPDSAANGTTIFIKDLLTGAITEIPNPTLPGAINSFSFEPVYSHDGSSIVFTNYAQYLVDGILTETNGIYTYKIGALPTPAGEVIKGGTGIDTATYENSAAAVTVDLRFADGTHNTGDALKDTFVSIENFRLSSHDDSFIGLDKAGAKNSAFGLDGADTFTSGGVGTANTFDGGNGNDTFFGGAGKDSLSGGAGDDHITGGGGKDILSGGIGSDTFAFNLKEKGTETITDFELGIDKLQFNGITSHDLAIHASHGQTIIQIDHGATITLDGLIDVNALKHDFLFV